MRRLFALVAIVVLSLPALAFAAFNDVTLTTDANILVGGYTLNVSGSSATIQSMVVNSGSFSVTLASGSSLTVSSPTLQQLSSDITSDVTSNVCTGSASSISLAYSGGGAVSNVITPSATVCSGSGGASPPAQSAQGGGGLIVGSGPLAPGYVNTNPTGTSTVTAHGSTTVSTLPSESMISHGGITLIKNYQLWDRSEDIRASQKFFNTDGFIIAQSGPGSPGNETSIFGVNTYRVLIKFQNSKELPQTGYLGPLTRAALKGL
jgi:Putative peptidoglycan binding domain